MSFFQRFTGFFSSSAADSATVAGRVNSSAAGEIESSAGEERVNNDVGSERGSQHFTPTVANRFEGTLDSWNENAEYKEEASHRSKRAKAKGKKRKTRSVDILSSAGLEEQGLENGSSADVAMSIAQETPTPAPGPARKKRNRKSRKSNASSLEEENLQDMFPRVSTGEDRVAIFPLVLPEIEDAPNSVPGTKSGKGTKRKRAAESDEGAPENYIPAGGNVSGENGASEGSFKPISKPERKRRRKKRHDGETNEPLSQAVVAELEEGEDIHLSGAPSNDISPPKSKSRRSSKRNRHSKSNQDQLEKPTVESEDDVEANPSDNENELHEEDSPDAMASMLNIATRRGQVGKSTSPLPKASILPQHKTQTRIPPPPVPAWKLRASSSTPGQIGPAQPSATPIGHVPTPPPSTLANTLILPPQRKQSVILPPSRPIKPVGVLSKAQPNIRQSSNPILPTSISAKVTTSSSSSQLTHRAPPKSVTSILTPSTPSSPAISSSKSPAATVTHPKPETGTFSPITPQVIIKSRPRSGLLSVSHLVDSDHGVPQLQPGMAHLTAFEQKTRKTKQIIESKKDISWEDASDEVEPNDYTAPLRRHSGSASPPLLSANYAREKINDVHIAPNGMEDRQNHMPKQPSLKALGKRKAVDKSTVAPAKKPSPRNPSTFSNLDIRQFGVVVPSQGRPSTPSVVETRSTSPSSTAEISRSIGGTPSITTPFANPPHSKPATASIPPVHSSRASSSVPILPPSIATSLGSQRRSTPHFTPINKPSKQIEKRSASSQAVAVQSLTIESRIKVKPPTNKALISFAQHQAASSSRKIAYEDDVDMPDVDQLPQPEVEKPSSVSSDSSVSGDYRGADVSEREEKSKSETPQQPLGSSPPQSNVHRKRRLPTGEVQSMESGVASSISLGSSAKTPRKDLEPPKANSSQGRPLRIQGLTNGNVETIREAVENYGRQHDMDRFTLNARVQLKGGPKSNEFWEEICSQVPGVSKVTVVNYCRRAFHNFIRGSWSEEQDDELRDAYERFPGKWQNIGELMNRFPEDARVRWRDYVSIAVTMKSDVWDFDEEERLRQVHADYLEDIRKEMAEPQDTRVKKPQKPKAKDAESLVDWTVVSQKMGGTRSRLQCLQKWAYLKQREAGELAQLGPIGANWRVRDGANRSNDFRAAEKLRLLRAIRDSGAAGEKKIPWTVITKELDMKGQRMALKVCFRNLMVNVPDYEELKLQDIVSNLIYAFEAAAPYEPRGFDKVDRTIRDALDVKTREKRTRKYYDEQFPLFHGNGEGSSRKGFRKIFKSNQLVTNSSDEEDDTETPGPLGRKKKIRERMKRAGEDQNQELQFASVEEIDLEGELRTAWASVTPKSKAKKPIFTAKVSQRKKQPQNLSNEDERSDVDDDAMQIDKRQIPVQLHDGDDDRMSEADNEVTSDLNDLVDVEAIELSENTSSEADDDKEEPPATINSPVDIKSEDSDTGEAFFNKSERVSDYEDQKQAPNVLPRGFSSTSSDSGSDSDSDSESDENIMANRRLQNSSGRGVEDLKPILPLDPTSESDSNSDSDEEQDVNEFSRMNGETVNAEVSLKMRYSSPSDSDLENDEDDIKPMVSPASHLIHHGDASAGLPAPQVNHFSPAPNHTTNSFHPYSNSDIESHGGNIYHDDLDASDDANEHTITMNGWDQLPGNLSDSSADASSSDEEEIQESKQHPVHQEDETPAESSLSDGGHVGDASPPSTPRQQETKREYMKGVSESPYKSNTSSLGSAWMRTRRVFDRNRDDASVSSDETTSSIPAVAVSKPLRDASIEL